MTDADLVGAARLRGGPLAMTELADVCDSRVALDCPGFCERITLGIEIPGKRREPVRYWGENRAERWI